ncbi:MAG: NAD(P)-binding domain-containing protein, partial [Parvularculaceae bacterium]
NALRYALEKGGASKDAANAGAANMLTFAAAGPYAENSDVAGFAAALAEVLTAADTRAKAVVLGAGGGARGVVLALKALGYAEIIVANRTRARAETLARDLKVDMADWEERGDALAGADVLINATSFGMTEGGEPLTALDKLPATAIVADIVYAMRETALVAAARTRGLRAFDGLSMLMHQAVPAYIAWLGRIAVVDAGLRAELERAIADGSRR